MKLKNNKKGIKYKRFGNELINKNKVLIFKFILELKFAEEKKMQIRKKID